MTRYSFKAKIWKYKGPAAWYFVTLPKSLSKKIRTQHGLSEEGWGRLKTTAEIGNSNWDTAIWFDTKAQSYLLPVKSVIRKKEKILDNSVLNINLQFKPDENIKNRGMIRFKIT